MINNNIIFYYLFTTRFQPNPESIKTSGVSGTFTISQVSLSKFIFNPSNYNMKG